MSECQPDIFAIGRHDGRRYRARHMAKGKTFGDDDNNPIFINPGDWLILEVDREVIRDVVRGDEFERRFKREAKAP